MCVVMNARHVGKRPATDRVYVGRPSKWGNPFVIGRDGSARPGDSEVSRVDRATARAHGGAPRAPRQEPRVLVFMLVAKK